MTLRPREDHISLGATAALLLAALVWTPSSTRAEGRSGAELFAEAERAFLAGDFDQAAAHAQRALLVVRGDDAARAAMLLGRAEAGRGNHREAHLAFSRALETAEADVTRAAARVGLARAFLAQGETDAARRVLSTLAEEAEKGGAARHHRGEIEALLRAAAQPPGGAAQPPGGAAQPPGETAQPPGETARPPGGAAQPPGGAAEASDGARALWVVQVGAFREAENARRMLESIRDEVRGIARKGFIQKEEFYLVFVGPYEDRAAAASAAEALTARGIPAFPRRDPKR